MKDEKSLKKLLRVIKLKQGVYEDNKNEIDKYLEKFQKNELAEVEKELIFKKECYQSEIKPFSRMLPFLSISLAFIGMVFKELPAWMQILACIMAFLCIVIIGCQYFKIIYWEPNRVNIKSN